MADRDIAIEKEMKEFISAICEEIGPRPPCSEEEKQGAQYFCDKISEYCDEINIEKFYTHPSEYKLAFRFPMVLYIVSIIFYLPFPWISLIIEGIALIIIWGTMALARQTVAKILPKKSSQNVIGKIKPKEEPKNLLIFGSHIDANWEFPLNRKLGFAFALIFALNIFLNVIIFVMLIIKNILILLQLEAFFFGFYFFMLWIFVAGIPIALVQFLFVISNRPVMGANDNLSGTAVCYELAKNLSDPKNKPKSVEVWINSYGCEEIGSKGSRAFILSHYDEIKDAKTINLDMIGNKDVPLRISTSEIIGLVKMDKYLEDLIKEVAQDLGIEVKSGNSMAYTDSMSFARKNLPAISLTSFPKSSKEFYYHTRDDVIENMDFKNLVDTYKICMEIIKKIENKLNKEV